jgi:hypothetical protein
LPYYQSPINAPAVSKPALVPVFHTFLTFMGDAPPSICPTADNDVVLLEKDSVNLLLYELCELVAQELQGEDSSFDLKYWQNKNKEVE